MIKVRERIVKRTRRKELLWGEIQVEMFGEKAAKIFRESSRIHGKVLRKHFNERFCCEAFHKFQQALLSHVRANEATRHFSLNSKLQSSSIKNRLLYLLLERYISQQKT